MLEQGALGTQGAFQFLAPFIRTSDPHACRQAIWTIAFSFFFLIETYFIMLIVTLAGPNLISRDLRNNALPLYLSRPLTRLDYFLGKLGVIGGIVGMVAVLPAAAAYVLGVCFSLDASVIRDTWRILPGSILYGAVIVVSAGTLILALSSLSRRSLYVGLAWFAVCLISWVVGMVLETIRHEEIEHRVWSEYHRNNLDWDGRPANHRFRDGMDFGPQAISVHEAARQAAAKDAPTDWRPLFSYAWNVQRLGEVALSTDDAWVKLARALNEKKRTAQSMLAGSYQGEDDDTPADDREFADTMVFQYPWKWSAGVLAAIVGISLWILSLRVKSLDRLR
jgi:hypothetical protein